MLTDTGRTEETREEHEAGRKKRQKSCKSLAIHDDVGGGSNCLGLAAKTEWKLAKKKTLVILVLIML